MKLTMIFGVGVKIVWYTGVQLEFLAYSCV